MLVMAVYLGKLGIFFAPMRMALLATIVASFGIVRLYLAYQVQERITDRAVCKILFIMTFKAWFFVAATGACLFITRHVIIGKMLQFFMDTRYYELTESRLFGAFLFAWGLHVSPISYSFLPQSKPLRRLNVVLLVLGVVWSFWTPSLQQSAEDMTLAAEYSSAEWVPWIMIVVILFGLAAFAAPKKYSQATIFRQIIVGSVAVGLGLSFSGTYLRFAPLYIYALLCVQCCLVAFVLYATHFPMGDEFKSAFVAYVVFHFDNC